VVCGVTEALFHGSIRVVEKAVSFRTVWVLYHMFCEDVVTDI
jgi:hypothetical protein